MLAENVFCSRRKQSLAALERLERSRWLLPEELGFPKPTPLWFGLPRPPEVEFDFTWEVRRLRRAKFFGVRDAQRAFGLLRRRQHWQLETPLFRTALWVVKYVLPNVGGYKGRYAK